jgi:hypothetical protein
MRVSLVVVALFLCLARPLLAAPPIIVLESHVGERTSDADYLLSPLLSEVAERGYSVGSLDLGAEVDKRLSRPGLTLDDEALAETIRLVDAGWESWFQLDLPTVIDKMSLALARFQRSPATLAQNQTRRDLVYKALIGLALAHKRTGNVEQATRAIAELIRSFSDRDFNRSMYGPEPHDLYRAVKAELAQHGRGSLRVEVDDATAVIFLNEQYVGVGSAHKADLFPGRYRVYVQKGSVVGRLHEVDIRPGVEENLVIAWGFEAALHTGKGFVGFRFTDAKDRQTHEAEYATMVARALGASGVVVVTLQPVQGRRAVVGAVLSLDTGRATRTASLALEPVLPDPMQLRGLGRFLAGGEPMAGLIVTEEKPMQVVTAQSTPQRRPYRPWKWLTLGTGVATSAVGVGLLVWEPSRYDDDGRLRPQHTDTTLPGLALVGAGAALVGAGAWLWHLDTESPQTTARVVPARDGFAVSLAGTF